MKKALLYSFLASICFFSCKKDHNSPTITSSGKYYKINYNLSGFTETIGTQLQRNDAVITDDVSDTSSSDVLTTLCYQVYDSNGKVVHPLIKRISPTGAFGALSDSLHAGTYTVVVVVGKSLGYTIALDPMSNRYISTTTTDYITSGTSSGDLWTDTFFKQFQLTVSGRDTAVGVVLPRIVSQLEVNIEDAIPANVSYFTISYTNPITKINIQSGYITGTTANANYKVSVPAASIGTTNFQMYDILVPNPTIPGMTVYISAYDVTNSRLYTKEVDNVVCQPNERTILTGRLFSAISGNTFQTTINGQWNPNPYLTINY